VWVTEISPDGRWLLTADETTFRVWELGTGRQLYQGSAKLRGAKFSADGKQLTVTASDGMVRTLDAQTGNETGVVLPRRELHQMEYLYIARDGRMASDWRDEGSSVTFWDGKHGSDFKPLSIGGPIISALAFAPRADLAAVAFDNGSVVFADTQSGKAVQTLIGHSGSVRGVGFSPDGNKFISAGADGIARIWSVPDGKPGCMLLGHQQEVVQAAISEDGSSAVTIGSDGVARMWELTQCQTQAVLKPQSGFLSVQARMGARQSRSARMASRGCGS
jgi:WD40 repeat protein